MILDGQGSSLLESWVGQYSGMKQTHQVIDTDFDEEGYWYIPMLEIAPLPEARGLRAWNDWRTPQD
jgi:hypothetical protein